MSIQLYTGAQINLGDLTPYLTYEVMFHKTLCAETDMRVQERFSAMNHLNVSRKKIKKQNAEQMLS